MNNGKLLVLDLKWWKSF